MSESYEVWLERRYQFFRDFEQEVRGRGIPARMEYDEDRFVCGDNSFRMIRIHYMPGGRQRYVRVNIRFNWFATAWEAAVCVSDQSLAQQEGRPYPEPCVGSRERVLEKTIEWLKGDDTPTFFWTGP